MMPSLPNEIILEIFEGLDNISDCLHLGRCCRQFYGVLELNRLRIMRRAISQSSVHKYDAKLCHFKDAYWAWASQNLCEFRELDDPIPVEAHPLPSSFAACFNAKELSDEQIWDIVTRWQGLVLLQDIYLHPSIRRAYCDSTLLQSYLHLSGGDDLLNDSPREEPIVDIHTEFLNRPSLGNEDRQDDVLTNHHRDASLFERFYLAATGFWLLSEAMRFAKICRYPKQTDENRVWGHVDALWRGGRAIHEVFHMIEVYDFVYDYLTRYLHYSSTETFTTWLEDRDHLAATQTTEETWEFFELEVRDSLTPADIIELFILTAHWRRAPGREWAPTEKSKYLKMRLFFDTWYEGQVAINDVGESPDVAYTTRDLESSLETKLRARTSLSQAQLHDKWIHYRKNKWYAEARGKALAWALSDGVIADRILAASRDDETMAG